MNGIVIACGVCVVVWLLVIDLQGRGDEDWPAARLAPRLDRVDLLELPYSPWVSDDEALALLDEIRALPEVAA